MAFQFAGGTYVRTSFVPATRQDIVESIRTHLNTAGWTDVSGGVGDRKLDCVTTPQALDCRIRVYDPGSGNCARVKFMTQDEVRQGIDLFLIPDATFTIIANKYQFFVYAPGLVTPRHFICGGVPFLEDFLDGVTTEAIWCHGDAQNDGGSAAGGNFRLRAGVKGQAWSWQTRNTSAWGGTQDGIGSQRLEVTIRGNDNSGSVCEGPTLWHNDWPYKIPARIAWGLESESIEAKVQGQLWNAAVIHKDYPMDRLATWEEDSVSYDWINLTNSNVLDYGRPSLWVAYQETP